MTFNEIILGAQELLGLIHSDTQSARDKELLLAAFDALGFIARAGHVREFEDYRKHLGSERPPFVVAAFATRAEAEQWLRNVRYPPDSAYVLIADEYHIVMDFPRTHGRLLRPYPIIFELYLQSMLEDGPPHVVASFGTQQDARAWFEHLNEKPAQAIVDIDGERYVAGYHYNIDYLAFHPFVLVQMPNKEAGAQAE